MLELMKGLGFIPESKVLLLQPFNGKAFGIRYDRVTYIGEPLDIPLGGQRSVFVEADKFLPLLPYIRSIIARPDYLVVNLDNGAVYKLPYMQAEFDCPAFSLYQVSGIMKGSLDFSAVKKTALQNLVNPEMRCIYVDTYGAISCDYIRGTYDRNLFSTVPVLIPPDMYNYAQSDKTGALYKLEDTLFLEYDDGSFIASPTGDFSAQEGAPWYQTIREKASTALTNTPIPTGMEEALKRLALFSNKVVFTPQYIQVNDDYREPHNLTVSGEHKYEINDLLSVISFARNIAVGNDAIYLYGDNKTVVISEVEEE